MSETLKKKTVSGLIWNAIDKVGVQVVALIVGIVTARLLSPKDFGIIGALSIFTLLSNTLVESGFTAALIRRKNNTDEEYSAILYLNILLSIFLYLVLFIFSPKIAEYFSLPELDGLSKFLFLSIILNSFSLIQNIILTRQLAFRLMTQANLTSVIIAGVATIIMVFNGINYWALAWQQVLQVGLKTIFFWIASPWKGLKKPDFRIVKETFSFSIMLLSTSILGTISRNIYSIFIGKLYSIQELGYYSQANKYQQIPSSIITSTQAGVAYPVVSKLEDEPERQLLYMRKIIKVTAFFIFPLMIGLVATVKELVSIVLTDKWLPAVPYFKILSITAIISPFHTLILSMLIAKGHPKLNFTLEMLKNGFIICFLLIFIGSIKMMLIGFSTACIISYAADIFSLSKKSKYTLWNQIKDIAPYAVISCIMYFVLKAILLLHLGKYTTLIVQCLAGTSFYIGILKISGSKILNDVTEIFKKKK